MTLQICVIVNVWKDQAQPIAVREEKSTANTPQIHVTICSQLIPSAHARELRLLQDAFGVDASMHGGYCRPVTSTLLPLSAGTAAVRWQRLYI